VKLNEIKFKLLKHGLSGKNSFFTYLYSLLLLNFMQKLTELSTVNIVMFTN